MKEVHAYPLSWPIGWKRTPDNLRASGKFVRTERQYSNAPGGGSWLSKREMTTEVAVKRLVQELDRMGIPDYELIISTNAPLRRDGAPRSDVNPQDPGAAVYWKDFNGQRVMAIDRYSRLPDNIAALAATIEAMRAIERHGGAVILDRAFSGFAALPAPITGQKPWRQVLGVGPGEREPEAIRNYYRVRRGETHPDREGGNALDFLAVQAAYEQAARELGFAP